MHTAAERFAVFGTQHLLVLAVFLAGCAVLWVAGARLRARPGLQARVMLVSGVAILVLCAPFEVRDAIVGLRHPLTGLPLQLCDFGWLVAGLALVTGSRSLCALLYFWGLTLCIQGVVTPDLDDVFPELQFFGFWVRHIIPVWAAVYLVGARIGPTWRGFRFAVLVTLAWAVVVMCLNFVIGSNYGYLNGKPAVSSALDLLGPWPWYVVVEVVLVIGVWALMTWPWCRRRCA